MATSPIKNTHLMTAVISADTVAIDGGTYYVDCTANEVTLTVGSDVKAFTVHDYGNTYTDANNFIVDIGDNAGVDQFIFHSASAGVSYSFVRDGTSGFRAYAPDGTITIVGIT